MRVAAETNGRGIPGLRLAMCGTARRGRPVMGLALLVLGGVVSQIGNAP